MLEKYVRNLRWISSKVQNWLIKGDEDDLGFGIDPFKRPPEMYIRYGVINLDKPPGPTSHQVASWVKRILSVSKTGHGGTLDPKVSGILPIGLERSTIVMRYVIGAAKEYVGLIHLHSAVPLSEIERVFSMFKGPVYQRPPQRSSVRRKLRTKNIYSLKILEIEGRNVLFSIVCESGFYVRKFAHDIGLILGCNAHLAELRRVRAGPFDEYTHLTTLYELAEAYYEWKENHNFNEVRKVIMPLEVVFRDYPKIIVKDTAVASIIYGAQLKAPGVLAVTDDLRKNSRVALITKKGELIAVAHALHDAKTISELKKGEVTKTERVIMEKGIYPPLWKSYNEAT